MNTPWTAELWRIGVVVCIALLLGAPVGYPALFLALGLGGYLGWHLLNLYRLERWLRIGRQFHPPEGGGIWGEVFHHIYQLQQRNRLRKRRLASLLEQFREATSALPDAIVVLGVHGEIEWFNEAARQVWGLHPGMDRGQRIDNLVRNPRFVSFIGEGDESATLEMPSPEDDTMMLNLRVVPYGDARRLLVARDVSQRRQLEKVRRDFVANVSHELRTPLTVISGFLETLMDGSDACQERCGRPLALMQQQAARMQHIVEDLLLLSKLETDRSAPPQEPASVPAILASIREEAVLLSGEKEHEIRLLCETGVDLYGLEAELHSAFGNLVSNAVRYTPKGGTITLRWYEDREGAHFAVSDTGIGIRAEFIPRLTERFYRVDVGRSRDSGGTGLGLAIVKHVLSRYKAKLRIDSEPGRGSTFTCDFPPERLVRKAA